VRTIFLLSFSRFAHSTDSSIRTLLACYNEDGKNTHSKDFSFWYFHACQSHFTEQQKKGKKRKKNKDGNKTIFLATKEQEIVV
jgi:hypothetical protein